MKLRKITLVFIFTFVTVSLPTQASTASKNKPPVTDSEAKAGSWFDQFLDYFSF